MVHYRRHTTRLSPQITRLWVACGSALFSGESTPNGGYLIAGNVTRWAPVDDSGAPAARPGHAQPVFARGDRTLADR
jgi:hypothetical protein